MSVLSRIKEIEKEEKLKEENDSKEKDFREKELNEEVDYIRHGLRKKLKEINNQTIKNHKLKVSEKNNKEFVLIIDGEPFVVYFIVRHTYYSSSEDDYSPPVSENIIKIELHDSFRKKYIDDDEADPYLHGGYISNDDVKDENDDVFAQSILDLIEVFENIKN